MANNLRKLRGKHQITVTALGKEVGVTKQAISKSEKTTLSFQLASKIAKVLGENVFTILGTDALSAVPTTDEDKEALIDVIRSL